ncbi:hypothetical protein OGAPHI_002524 [Ogataea philodendri]|uniref:AD domain-containing protein n=1 Tax=Ogataea philodendri TaxID=1378263 RepID=A0A9P8PC59_9ASCO|nr:uncharacterized protein OGAPHI_002524 [Ogataea philodendri]KAH3668769.1 hypothetical protein OGAPHI_002524 [Ogataea philodendri]
MIVPGNWSRSSNGTSKSRISDSIPKKRVKLVTLDDNTIVGTVHSYTPNNGLLSLITESKTPTKENFVVIKNAFIKSIVSLSKPKESKSGSVNEKFASDPRPPYPIPLNMLGHNYKVENSQTVRKLQSQYILASTLGGRKITTEGKEIFTSLFNLLPDGDVSMDKNDNIIVFDNHIVISKPYGVENCKTVSGHDEQQLSYIRKIIKDVWRQLESNRKGG